MKASWMFAAAVLISLLISSASASSVNGGKASSKKATATSLTETYTVWYGNDGTYSVTQDGTAAARTTGGVAAATVIKQPSFHSIGWDVVNVSTVGDLDDDITAYAVGFGEGFVMGYETWENYVNLYGHRDGGLPSQPLPNVSNYFQENWNWTVTTAEQKKDSDDYWYQVHLVVRQYEGFMAGAQLKMPSLTFIQLMYVVAAGDLYDIIPAMQVDPDTVFAGPRRRVPRADGSGDIVLNNEHCSALIKLSPTGDDIFFGHTTWSTYNSAMRQMKHYNFNFNASRGTNSKSVSFSGYPGDLTSVDDFYVTDTGLSVIETSLSIINTTIYEGNVVPQSLLYWVRVLVANRIATSGKEWVDTFAKYNSGTYNNQWIITDLNLFTPGQDLKPGTLYIAEQIPGQVGIRDRTDQLSFGYWPSYNIPSIPELYNITGFQEAKKFDPTMCDYETCVRANIFRRDQGKVDSLEKMQHMMRYNNWEKDPLSLGNPVFAISARGDLANKTNGGNCFGGIDSKVSSYKAYKAGRLIYAQSGPTEQQPIFNFDTALFRSGCYPRLALPDVWNFTWQTFSPYQQ